MLKFMDTAMRKDDTVEVLSRIGALNAVTYEDYQQARKKLAEKEAAG
ncbi:hypothetical protein ACIQ9M_34735 [Streptomyces californicus]